MAETQLAISYDENLALALGALASLDAISANTKVDNNRLQGFRVIKVRVVGSFLGKTTAEGPIIWGLASGLTAQNIEDIIESDPQSPQADDERGAGAWIKLLGQIENGATSGTLTPGMPFIDVDVNWSTPESQSFAVWAYNQDGAPLSTGTVLVFGLDIIGVWLRD